MNTMWIQEDTEFQDWENKPEQVEELMIGDTEYEVCPRSFSYLHCPSSD